MKMSLLKLLVVVSLFCMLIAAIAVTKLYFVDEWKQTTNTVRSLPTPNNCTLVTAFFSSGFDPSNSSTVHQHSVLTRLHFFLRPLLHLRLPMVLFTDPISAEFVAGVRQSIGMKHHTRIWNISLSELPLWANFSLFRSIVDEQFAQNETSPADQHSFNRQAEFHILSNSAPYFLANASMANPFNSLAFVWLDHEHGRGEAGFFPANFEWDPKFPAGKITLLKLSTANDSIYAYDRDALYRNPGLSLLSTEFMAGDRNVLEQFNKLFMEKLLDEAIHERFVDDYEQAILVLLVKQKPSLFNVVQGDWFNAFHLF